MHLITVPSTAVSQVVNVTGTAASSTTFSGSGQAKMPQKVIITPTLNCFARMTTAGTAAVATGVDMFLAANQVYETFIPDGYSISFIKQTGATDGPVYLTPYA